MSSLLGAAVFWKGKGFLFIILSFLLGLFYSDWRHRKWRPWHVGFIVKVSEDSIVTCEAVQKGVSYVEYESLEDMGDCRIYEWTNDINDFDIDVWVSRHIDLPYDSWGYVWTLVGGIAMKLFKKPFRVVNKPKFCWEVMSELYRNMGKEIQPAEEPVLINKMIWRVESCQRLR